MGLILLYVKSTGNRVSSSQKARTGQERVSQKLAQMTTENGGADGLGLCDWASGPLSLALCFSLPAGLGTTEAEDRSKLAAAAGGFGLGWAGLCLTVIPVGSLVGFEMGFWPWDGMMVPAYTGWLPSGSPSTKLFRVRCGRVWSGLYLSWPVLSLLWICRLQRERGMRQTGSPRSRGL